MKTIVTLSYFHRKIGPLVFYSFPEGILEEELSVRIANIMDQTFKESFFTLSFEKLNSMNYYFEISSDWARGNKEMLMISIIFEQQTTLEMEQNVSTLSNEFSVKLQANDEVFTAFYINDLNNFDESDKEIIIKNNSLIKLWVKELYWATIEETREKSEEEKISYLLNKEYIFKTLEKLSKGPINLEDLEDWYSENFPDLEFRELIDTLVNNQFIYINKLGLVDQYVLLLKEVNAERIPPSSFIEDIEKIIKQEKEITQEEDSELIDLILNKITEYFSEYENKSKEDLKNDSFTLFQIISDPKKYNLLSELRDGLIRRDKLPKIVSKRTLDSLIEIIDFLKKVDVIEEVLFKDERYIVLKTNIEISKNFPKYLRKLLPKESKPVIAAKYSPKIDKFQEELSSGVKEKPSKKN